VPATNPGEGRSLLNEERRENRWNDLGGECIWQGAPTKKGCFGAPERVRQKVTGGCPPPPATPEREQKGMKKKLSMGKGKPLCPTGGGIGRGGGKKRERKWGGPDNIRCLVARSSLNGREGKFSYTGRGGKGCELSAAPCSSLKEDAGQN